MIRKTLVALLVAMVASFAFSSPADAAPKKPPRARAKHSSRATTGATAAKPFVKKKAARKSGTAKKSTTKKPTAMKAATKKAAGKAKSAKRKPTTKPR